MSSPNKTQPTQITPESFINQLPDPSKQSDARSLLKIFQDITHEPPVMWGSSIIGFGKYHYKYESGHSGDAPLAAFSPRSTALTIYCLGFPDQDQLLTQLGPHKTAKVCLYIRHLSDINLQILQQIITKSYHHAKKNSLRLNDSPPPS